MGFVLAIGTALITGGLALSQGLKGDPIEGPGGLWGSVFYLGAISVFTAILSVIPLRIRAFRVQGGMMTLVKPVRTVSGARIRTLSLKEVAHAERIAQLGADPGLLVTLRDGTKFPIFEQDLPREGRPFLDELLTVLAKHEPDYPPSTD